MDVKPQDSEEAQALLTTLFRGSEHEQAEQIQDEPSEAFYEPVEAVTDEIMPKVKEEPNPPEETSLDEDLEELEKSVAEYKQAKAEMHRLGFTDYDEYLDYIEFTKRKSARKSDLEM